MSREILVNVNPREIRAAVVENGATLELFIERASRSGIVELLEDQARSALTTGGMPFDVPAQRALARAVYDALFGLGRLQPLVDDDQVENIIITATPRRS